MTKPVVPSAMRPRKRFTIFPRTCAATRLTAKRHPHKRRLNQPMPAAMSAAARSRKGIPTCLPSRASSWYARGFNAHARSSIVPGQRRVVPARAAIAAPKKRKMPKAVIPWARRGWATPFEVFTRSLYRNPPF